MMADQTFADIDNRDGTTVFKALKGGIFLAPETAPALEALTADSAATPGAPTLAPLPDDYYGLGWLSTAGAVLSDAISTSDISGWGGLEPVRRDITSDVTTVQVVALQTTKNVMATFYGVDPSTITADTTTGEVSIAKPNTPQATYYRALVLGVDGAAANEMYFAHFLPRVSISARGSQTFAMGDDTGISWDMTFTAFTDPALGYADRFIAAGAGWKNLATATGFALAA